MKREKNVRLLVKQAKNQEKQAFGKIYDIFLNRVYRFVSFRIGVKEEAEDLTEEIFLKVFKNIKDYKEEKNIPFEAWLFRIARNSVTDYYRTFKKNVPLENALELPDGKKSPEEITIDKVSAEEVLRALRMLKSSYQEIIILKYIEEKDSSEISKILKKPSDQVRVLKSRALNALRKKIKENENEKNERLPVNLENFKKNAGYYAGADI